LQKNLLRLAMLLSVAAVLTVSAPRLTAQDGMSSMGAMGGDNAEAMQKLQKMSAALHLTPEQKKQMLPILMDEGPKLKALKSDTSMPPMEKAMKMRTISQDTNSKVKPILNPEQYQKFEQMRTQERQQMIQKMENK
jgi:predicted transglutaminase-like cysteine proteinase